MDVQVGAQVEAITDIFTGDVSRPIREGTVGTVYRAVGHDEDGMPAWVEVNFVGSPFLVVVPITSLCEALATDEQGLLSEAISNICNACQCVTDDVFLADPELLNIAGVLSTVADRLCQLRGDEPEEAWDAA